MHCFIFNSGFGSYYSYRSGNHWKKNITAESINISLRGSKEKLDYTIPKQEKWQKMLEY